WRVEGLRPGVYVFNHQTHALHGSGAVPTGSEAVELFVQDEFASAPAMGWISGNLAAACARHGAFGHRQLLLRAGAAAHRLGMAALGMDLSGTIVAGVVPGAARKLGFNGYTEASLVAFVMGHDAERMKRPPTRRGPMPLEQG